MSRWIEYNPNPNGLITIDCTIRAICAVTGWTWYRAYDEVTAKGKALSDMPSADRVWWAVLDDLGFERFTIENTCPRCYTVEDFAHDHQRGMYILTPHQHAVALIDGNWLDTWDSGKTIPTSYFRR